MNFYCSRIFFQSLLSHGQDLINSNHIEHDECSVIHDTKFYFSYIRLLLKLSNDSIKRKTKFIYAGKNRLLSRKESANHLICFSIWRHTTCPSCVKSESGSWLNQKKTFYFSALEFFDRDLKGKVEKTIPVREIYEEKLISLILI